MSAAGNRWPASIVDGELRCPDCGETGNLWHAETILVGRRLHAMSENGKALVFEALSEVLDDTGEDERLLCRSCAREWALPLPAEFV